jgi:hypothetical protein
VGGGREGRKGGLGLGIGIGDWDWGLGLGIGKGMGMGIGEAIEDGTGDRMVGDGCCPVLPAP